MVYCSLFQDMKLVMHKPTEKMLPIGLFLCFAVLTVHSKNYDIPSTLHEKYLLQFCEFTTRFKIGSVYFWFTTTLQGAYVGWRVVDKRGTLHVKNSLVTSGGTSCVFANQFGNRDVSYKPYISLESVKFGVTNISSLLHDLQCSYTSPSAIQSDTIITRTFICLLFNNGVTSHHIVTNCLPQKTTSGKCCSIPFTYRGVTYNSCTSVNHNRPWCSLDPVYKGRWGNCREF